MPKYDVIIFLKLDDILRNVLLGIALAAPIGPAGVAVIQGGLSAGFRRAFLTGLGITSADLTYMLVVFFGLAGWISIPLVKGLIWVIGALVLFYLGIDSIVAGGRRIDFDTPSEKISRPPFLVGYLVNISNPIAVVFWLGIFGSLMGSGIDQGLSLNGFLRGLSILIGILLWHTSMSVLTHWGKRFVNEKTARIISILAGSVLMLFGLRFALNAVQILIA